MTNRTQIPGFEGYYATRNGEIWSCRGARGLKPYLPVSEAKKLRFTPDKQGYLTVWLAGKLYLVHRIICLTFHGGPPFPGAQVRHFPDRDKANVHADNLVWGTAGDNQRDRKAHGTYVSGAKASRALFSQQDVDRIRSEAANGPRGTLIELARQNRVSINTISNLVRRVSYAD